MNVTHRAYPKGDGYDIIISFSPQDFGFANFELEKFKLFRKMKEENLEYAGQNSSIARECALEWLSGGKWKYYLQEVAEYRKLKKELDKKQKDEELTIQKCLEFLKNSGFEFKLIEEK